VLLVKHKVSTILALQRAPEELNIRAADVWSFGILLWELNTREVPFAELPPMEAGMKVSTRHKLSRQSTALPDRPRRTSCHNPSWNIKIHVPTHKYLLK
jgi:hypothetical protein